MGDLFKDTVGTRRKVKWRRMMFEVCSLAPCIHTGDSHDVYGVFPVGIQDKNQALVITGNYKLACFVMNEANGVEK